MFCHNGICLRVLEEKDIERVRKLRNDPATWIHLTDTTLLDSYSQQEWFKHLANTENKKYFVLCDSTHDFLGIIRCDEIDKTNRSIRVGCDIVVEFRGQGYARQALELIKKYSFDFLNMHRIWLAVLETNTKAIHLYQTTGFKEEGRYRQAIFRDGVYIDYIIMSLLEEEYRKL